MHVVFDKTMTVEVASAIASQIETQIQNEFEEIMEMNVIIEPYDIEKK